MSDIIVTKITEYGIIGVVLAWFMLRMEKIIISNTNAINSMSLVIQKLCDDYVKS